MNELKLHFTCREVPGHNGIWKVEMTQNGALRATYHGSWHQCRVWARRMWRNR